MEERGDDDSNHRKLHHESVDDAPEDGDEVKHVPPVFEVTLRDNEVIVVTELLLIIVEEMNMMLMLVIIIIK